nr:hypothetical protein [uncultured Brevundimonas sp.]
MSSRHEIRLALERDYRICLGEYERAEMPTETIIGLKALEKADRAIQARKRVLKEKMEHIDYLLRLQVDAEWTPHHLTPLHPRKPRRRGSIAKCQESGRELAVGHREHQQGFQRTRLALPPSGLKQGVAANSRRVVLSTALIDCSIPGTGSTDGSSAIGEHHVGFQPDHTGGS